MDRTRRRLDSGVGGVHRGEFADRHDPLGRRVAVADTGDQFRGQAVDARTRWLRSSTADPAVSRANMRSGETAVALREINRRPRRRNQHHRPRRSRRTEPAHVGVGVGRARDQWCPRPTGARTGSERGWVLVVAVSRRGRDGPVPRSRRRSGWRSQR